MGLGDDDLLLVREALEVGVLVAGVHGHDKLGRLVVIIVGLLSLVVTSAHGHKVRLVVAAVVVLLELVQFVLAEVQSVGVAGDLGLGVGDAMVEEPSEGAAGDVDDCHTLSGVLRKVLGGGEGGLIVGASDEVVSGVLVVDSSDDLLLEVNELDVELVVIEGDGEGVGFVEEALSESDSLLC